MALTKIGSIGINTGIAFAGVTTIATLNASDNVLSVGGTVNFVSDVSIGGTVSIAGTLTYEDVTNVDAVGLITARDGINVGSGITLSVDGDGFFTGIITATFAGDGSSLTGVANTDVIFTDKLSIGDSPELLAVGIGSDLSIFHDGANSRIENSSGQLVIRAKTAENSVVLNPDGAVELYHDNSKKLETASGGVTVTGTLAATAVTGDGSALTGIGGTDFIHAEQVSVSGIVTASTFVSTAGQFFAERNKLINGEMRIFQRGDVVDTTDKQRTSLGSAGTNYTADHWTLYTQTTNARFTVRRVNGDHPDGFGQSLKITCTTADTSLAATEEVQFLQKIEGFETQDFAKGTSSAKQYTLSFYAKSTKTGTYIVRLLGRHNTNRNVSASYTISDTNWNRYVVTFPADTTAVDNPDNTEALRVVWWLVAGSGVNNGTLQTTWANASDTGAATGQVNFADSTSNIFYITGCQLEVGDVATPFEHRKYTRDLHDCYRYYRRWQPNINGIRSIADYSGFSSSTILSGGGLDADDAGVDRFLIPEMNHAPTVETFTDLVLVAGDAVYNTTTTVQENYSSPDLLRLHIDNGGGMNNDTYYKRLAFKANSGDFAVESEI